MADWAEIRRLHYAEGMPIKVIARAMGCSKNTVRAAVRSEGPPRYARPAKGSVVDEVEPRIRELLQAWPTMPATVIAERIGWSYSIRVLRRQRELKRALDGVRVALKDAEAKRDERMIELGTLLKPIVMSHPDYAGLRASLGHAEQLVAEREQALAATNASFREQAAKVDAEIAAVDPALSAARADVEARKKEYEETERLRQKHEARRKRVEIDVR